LTVKPEVDHYHADVKKYTFTEPHLYVIWSQTSFSY